MRLLFLGDVVGRSGRKPLSAQLPGLIAKHAFDFVVVNGENAAAASASPRRILQELLAAGADCVTTGNHVLGPARGALLRRPLRTVPPPDQLPARHARPRRPTSRGAERARVLSS